MDLIQSIMLGLLQGATEFLPISSSGHLVLAETYFHIEQASLTFDVALHMGTVVAILIYFRQDFLDILRSFLPHPSPAVKTESHRRLFFYICLGTIPAVCAALLFNDFIETTFRQPYIVACMLFVGGVLLIIAEKFGSHSRPFEALRLNDALLIGFAQALALMPGVSRSGITMTAALFIGMQRPAAARFSFLLSAPIVLGAGLYHIPEIIDHGLPQASPIFYLTGFIASIISGYLFISFLIRFVQHRSLEVFAYYRFILAALVLLAM